jgi:hypothetical protein
MNAPRAQPTSWKHLASLSAICLVLSIPAAAQAQAQSTTPPQKRPNVVMLMTDDTGWNDFGAYTGGG